MRRLLLALLCLASLAATTAWAGPDLGGFGLRKIGDSEKAAKEPGGHHYEKFTPRSSSPWVGDREILPGGRYELFIEADGSMNLKGDGDRYRISKDHGVTWVDEGGVG